MSSSVIQEAVVVNIGCRLSPPEEFRNDFPELLNRTNLYARNENSPAEQMLGEAENSGTGQQAASMQRMR
jgi:hypothetical protein